MQTPSATQATNDYVKRPRTELVRLLVELAGHYKKRYCWPSQDKICELFETRHGIHLSRRSLNSQLGALERDGWINRTRRHRIEPGRGMAFRSTLYTFTHKAMRLVLSAVAAVAFFVGGTQPTWAKKPCATPSSISLSTIKNDAVPPQKGVSGNSKKDSATNSVAEMRKILAR